MQKERIKRFKGILRRLSIGAKEEKLRAYGLPAEVISFTFGDPFALLIGVLADYQIQARRAWALPFHLRERLGELSPEKLAEMSVDEIEAKIRNPKSLHRFPRQMAMNIQQAARRVSKEYGGKAENIWATGSLVEFKRRLVLFRGMGKTKKVPMMIKMLIRDHGVFVDNPAGVHLAYDEQLRRVLLRTGLMRDDSVLEMERVGQLLNPEYPAAFDDALWLIGENFCHTRKPDCAHCPLTKTCAKKNIRETAEL